MKEDSGMVCCYLTPCNYTIAKAAKEKAGIENPESCMYLIDGSKIGSECQVDALATSPSSPVNVVTEVILNITVSHRTHNHSELLLIVSRPVRMSELLLVILCGTLTQFFYKYSLAAGETPMCVLTSVHIWVKLDDKKVEEHIASPFQTVTDLFHLLKLST